MLSRIAFSTARRLKRSAWGEIPDEGARALEVDLVACEDLREPRDVDTPEGWMDDHGES